MIGVAVHHWASVSAGGNFIAGHIGERDARNLLVSSWERILVALDQIVERLDE